MEIYVDGASRGNRGPSAYAYIYVKKGEGVVHQNYGFLGTQTNNMAEYKAIINALREAEKFSRWNIELFSDSELVINQINGDYRIRAKHLSDLCNEVYGSCEKFENVKFFHVSRNHPNIMKCDSLCNKCLNEMGFN